MRDYEDLLKRHVRPKLGSRRLDQLTQPALERAGPRTPRPKPPSKKKRKGSAPAVETTAPETKPASKHEAAPDVRLYDLRHTCATLLLAAGENPKVVSERLGHASVTLTLDTYSHVLPTMQKAATDRLEAMLYGGT